MLFKFINIWKDKYGFAVIPPGDQGQKIVLDSLFKVYPNYAKSIQTIETFTPHPMNQQFTTP